MSYNDLARVCLYRREYQKAAELYEKSLWIKERVLGDEHSFTATSYNVAGLYSSHSEYERALSYVIKAYKICINKFGFEHPNTKSCWKNMEIIYVEWNPEGNFEQWLDEQMKETEHY